MMMVMNEWNQGVSVYYSPLNYPTINQRKWYYSIFLQDLRTTTKHLNQNRRPPELDTNLWSLEYEEDMLNTRLQLSVNYFLIYGKSAVIFIFNNAGYSLCIHITERNLWFQNIVLGFWFRHTWNYTKTRELCKVLSNSYSHFPIIHCAWIKPIKM
jgi:hypothetical protein